MTSLTAPSASYGRNTESPEPGIDQYQVLFQSACFPTEARKALEHLVSSVQWAGGGTVEKYDDCFALWPVEQSPEGALVARLMDGGRDRLGRPHALRVDAVYLESFALTAAPAQLAWMLSVPAWPGEPWTGNSDGINLNIGDAEGAVATALKQALAKRGIPRILIAHHSHFRAQGFDLIFDPEAPAGRSYAAPVEVNLSSPRENGIVEMNTVNAPESRRISYMWIVLAVMILGVFGANWWGYDRYKHLRVTCSGLQRQLKDVQEKLNSETSAHDGTSARLEELEKNLEPLRSNFSELTDRFDKAARDIDQMYRKLQALDKNQQDSQKGKQGGRSPKSLQPDESAP